MFADPTGDEDDITASFGKFGNDGRKVRLAVREPLLLPGDTCFSKRILNLLPATAILADSAVQKAQPLQVGVGISNREAVVHEFVKRGSAKDNIRHFLRVICAAPRGR
jgi:hypothetical protein